MNRQGNKPSKRVGAGPSRFFTDIDYMVKNKKKIGNFFTYTNALRVRALSSELKTRLLGEKITLIFEFYSSYKLTQALGLYI